MRGGVDKSLCLLALVFFCTRAEDAVSSEDLKTGLPEEDSKSAALGQSSAYSNADSSESDDILELARGPLRSAASAGAYANEGQASAIANAQSSLRENSLRPGLFPPDLGGNTALAESIAQANGGVNGIKPLPYQPGYDLNPYGLSAQAQAETQAQTKGGISSGSLLGPSYGSNYPLTSGSSSAQAIAEAQASANNAGSSGLYPVPNYLHGSGLNSAQAQAEAQAVSNSAGHNPFPNIYKPGYQQQYQSLYPRTQGSSSQAQAQAQAQTETQSQFPGGNLVGPSYPSYQYPLPLSPGINSATAHAEAQAMSGGYGSQANAQTHTNANAQSSAMATADAYSRVIPHHEYIMPHLIPGAKDAIVCTREGELHYFWSSAYQCSVCTCIRDLGTLRPVCAKCDGCMYPAPGPVPVPEPEPIPHPVTVAPLPPTPQVTCSPLPSGQPFQNPLNPCQICICRETVNWQGEPDVHIDCQQNPECIIPNDVTPLPPLPDGPIPVPLPTCDKFPPNVLFPHPTDVCKVCKCIVEPIGLGILEPKIVCMILPECIRPLPPPPAPEPITIPPMPVPIPIPPEPIPWPPATPAPIPGPYPGPGPLPGPAPHESCRPFPPNNPFQHPWDECQMCVCTEAYSYGRITIEVNCYTKKSCCYEPPYPEPVTATPAAHIMDKICEYRSIGVEFLHPTDRCSVCVCELQGNLVTSACRRSQAPECAIIYYPGGSGSTAEAQASASAQSGSYNPIISGLPNSGQNQASAEANAVAQSSIQSGLQKGLKPWLQLQPDMQPWSQSLQPNQASQYYPVPGYGQQGGNQASASATAEAQANQYETPNIGPLPFYNLVPGLQGNINIPTPWPNNPVPVAEAEASANANAIKGHNHLYQGNYLGNSQKQLPYYLGNKNQLGLGTQIPGVNNVPLVSPAYSQLGGGGIREGSSALAQAEALANVLSNYGLPGGISQSSASAEAKANVQGLSLLPSGGSLYPRGSPSPVYQSPYLKQGYQTASALSQAQSSASGSQSQALALATSSVGKQGKSARDDIESQEDGPVD